MTEQEQSAQQPPEDEQPKRRRGRAVGAKASAGGRAQAGTSEAQTSDAGGSPQSKRQPANSGRNKKPQAQASDQETESTGSSESRSPVQDKGASAAQGQPAGNLDLGQLLQEQISLAIQPVLQDFRQQLATTVQHEVDQANDGPKRDGAAEARPESAPAQAALSSVTDRAQREPAEQKAKPEEGDASQPTRDVPESAPDEQQDSSSAQPAEASAPEAPEQTKPEASEPAASRPEEAGAQGQEMDEESNEESDGGGVGGLVKGGVRPTLNSAVKLVERQAEHVLQSALTGAIGALLAESTRGSVERGAEQGIRLALEKTSGALGDSPTVREIRAQTESTLLAIVREALDAVYADSLRSELQQHAEGASRDLLHRDVWAAVGHLSEVLQTLLQEIVVVLRRQWQRLLRLLLKVVLAALEESPPQSETPRLTGKRAQVGDRAGA